MGEQESLHEDLRYKSLASFPKVIFWSHLTCLNNWIVILDLFHIYMKPPPIMNKVGPRGRGLSRLNKWLQVWIHMYVKTIYSKTFTHL